MGFLKSVQQVPPSYLAASAGACIIGGIVIKRLFNHPPSSTDISPQKWIQVGKVQEIHIYPVKGVGGISVPEAVMGPMGFIAADNPLARDRVFAIIDKNGKYCSTTKFPALALTRVKLDGNTVTLWHIKEDLRVTFEIPTGSSSKGYITLSCGDKVPGVDCGDSVAEWLCQVTKSQDLRLLYHSHVETQRLAPKRSLKFTIQNRHVGAYQEETSYMLMTQESLDAVNSHLDKPVTFPQFRPTLVISGIPEPFSEDFWGYIKFGVGEDPPVMKTSLPCIRCKSTTVDQETGTFRDDGEPLRTLYKLKRPVGNSRTTQLVSKCAILGACFGVYSGEGKLIRVGDPVFAALL